MSIKKTGLEILQLIILFLWILFCALNLGNKIPFLYQNGFRFFAVTSGSMTPTIPVGSLVYVDKYIIGELKEGDVITFTKEGQVVTHRIFERKTSSLGQDNQGKITEVSFITKGDANTATDSSPVLARDILGKYKFYIPFMGYAASSAKTPLGFFIVILLPGLVIIMSEIVIIFSDMKSGYERKLKAEIEKLNKDLKN